MTDDDTRELPVVGGPLPSRIRRAIPAAPLLPPAPVLPPAGRHRAITAAPESRRVWVASLRDPGTPIHDALAAEYGARTEGAGDAAR